MAIPPQDQWHLLPKTRAEAKRLGVVHFLKTCKHGHAVPHWASDGKCTTCRRGYDLERGRARREEGIRELTTDGYYDARIEIGRRKPSNSPEAVRARTAQRLAQRRTTKALRVDRRPPNQSKEERKAIKAYETEVRARGNHPDHIVAFFHHQLRGLHTLANLQEVTPRRNRVKGHRGEYTPEQMEEFIQRGLAVHPEDVDQETGKVNWTRYPQHCNDASSAE